MRQINVRGGTTRDTITKRYAYEVNLADDNHAPTKILQLVGRNKRVLEVGCASGVQSRVMKEQLNCTVTGIEIDPGAAEEARPYCERILVGSIEQLDLDAVLDGAKYDAVIFADVLEHLFDPGKTLRKVASVLADDGCVIASIPNIAHSSVILGLAHGKFQYREFGLLDNTHIRFFTKESVYATFERSGYRIASLGRVIQSDCDSEARRVHVTQAERAVLEFVQQSNPESDTYQFIVKAFKTVEADGPTRGHRLSPEERITELEKKLSDKAADVRRLNSQLAWITSRPVYRFVRRVKNLLRPLKP